jgi:hypothetical protein
VAVLQVRLVELEQQEPQILVAVAVVVASQQFLLRQMEPLEVQV